VDAKTFEMVDGILARQGDHDDRGVAVDILEVGAKEGTLHDVALVVADRYAVRPSVIIEWYAEVLNRRVQETTAIIEKVKELTEGNVGSQ